MPARRIIDCKISNKLRCFVVSLINFLVAVILLNDIGVFVRFIMAVILCGTAFGGVLYWNIQKW